MSTTAMLWLAVISAVVGLGALGAFFATKGRYGSLRVLGGVSVIVAAISGYVSRMPEDPVVARGSLVGGQTTTQDPAAARCAQARAFSSNIPPECQP